jgi:hypothetical protein
MAHGTSAGSDRPGAGAEAVLPQCIPGRGSKKGGEAGLFDQFPPSPYNSRLFCGPSRPV